MPNKRGRPSTVSAIADTDPRATAERLLDAAEQLFAEAGFRAVSLRAINEAAGARNTSASHYHFGSKEALVDAVFARRMDALNRARMDRFAQIPTYPIGDPTPIVAAVRAVLDPTADLLLDPSGRGRNYLGCLVRAAVDPAIGLPRLAAASYQDMSKRFFEIVSRALPDVPPQVITFRMRLGIELGIHGLATINQMLRSADGSIDRAALDAQLQALTDFLVGGIAARVERPATDRAARSGARRHSTSSQRPPATAN